MRGIHAFISSECALEEFLHAFCNAPTALVARRFPNARAQFVRLTHFVCITYSPSTQADLQAAYERGAGIVCKPGQKGVDLLVPVKVICEDHNVQYSCLLFQVKNQQYVSPEKLEKDLDKLLLPYAFPELATDEFVGDSYIAIYLNLSFAQKCHVDMLESLPGVVLTGLGAPVFPFLRHMPLTCAALKRLLGARTDPVSLHSDSGQVVRCKALFPLEYHQRHERKKEKRHRK